jgi:hypothetical protein
MRRRKTNFKETGCEDMKCIQLAVVSCEHGEGSSASTKQTISFSSSILLHSFDKNGKHEENTVIT